jgi:energy-coupling factor transport system ATP-binding protein
VIRFERVSLTYPGQSAPVLRDVDLHVPEGELVLVVGRTGAGKSSLLLAVNGLAPHFTGGTLTGRVTVAGRATSDHPPRDLADVVGAVLQDPLDGFVTDTVEDELAYGMESVGLAPAVMRRRVEETLDLLGLADLRRRSLRTLSGGQQQRVAIGAVLAQHPKVLVLDEPTSALDPGAAEEVLAVLQRLVHDLGITVLVAEHRLERVVQFADRVVHVRDDGTVVSGSPADVLATAPVAPPVVELGRLAGWSPVPLSVREARRAATSLRTALADRPVPQRARPVAATVAPLAEVERLRVDYGSRAAVDDVSLALRAGEVVALMGRNGAGKSSLLRALVGLARPTAGRVRVVGADPLDLRGRDLTERVGFVPQEPADLLWAETVGEECRDTDTDTGAAHGTARGLFERLAPGVDDATHPGDLSEGQCLSLALAVVLAAGAPVLLLDEPTRGLDYPTKERVVGLLRAHAERGGTVLLATHDVELVAEVASRTLVLADGQLVSDGPTWEVLVGSPQFAPQVAKVLAPLPWLTVSEVAAALREAG